MEKRLEILLVEDDANTCREIVQEADNNPDDFFIIGVTNNSACAYRYITEEYPDAVILDLELHQGGGNGLELLNQIKESHLAKKPFFLITTNNISPFTHKIARESGADFIMTKNQVGYSAKTVLDFLKITKSVILSRKDQKNSTTDESPTQKSKRIQRLIYSELNKIGISPKSVGYQYLADAIEITMQNPVQHICNVIGFKYGKSENSVERAMQNAINCAWRTSDIDDLLTNYTARIKSDKGAPTLTEFIFYYATKIKNYY